MFFTYIYKIKEYTIYLYCFILGGENSCKSR